MKRTAKVWFVAALVSLLLAGPRLAADEAPERKVEAAEPAAGGTAIVDVGAVVTRHDGFRRGAKALKAEVAAVEKVISERDAELKQLEEEMNTASEAQAKQVIEKKLGLKRALLDEYKNRRRAELMGTEARLYDEVFDEILAEVNLYAREHGLRMVHNGSPPKLSESKPSEPRTQQEVMKRLNSTLLYVAPELDITEEILERVNRPEKP